MTKKVSGRVKLTIPAGQAAPSVNKISAIVGQKKISPKPFCDQFNAITANMKHIAPGTQITTHVICYVDGTFSIHPNNSPSIATLIKQQINISKGAQKAGYDTIGVLTIENIKKIIELKGLDIRSTNQLAIAKTICGSARSLGLSYPKESELKEVFSVC